MTLPLLNSEGGACLLRRTGQSRFPTRCCEEVGDCWGNRCTVGAAWPGHSFRGSAAFSVGGRAHLSPAGFSLSVFRARFLCISKRGIVPLGSCSCERSFLPFQLFEFNDFPLPEFSLNFPPSFPSALGQKSPVGFYVLKCVCECVAAETGRGRNCWESAGAGFVPAVLR